VGFPQGKQFKLSHYPTVLHRINRVPFQLSWINGMKGKRRYGPAKAQGYNTGKFPIPCGFLT
jgi:hypothetical protein